MICVLLDRMIRTDRCLASSGAAQGRYARRVRLSRAGLLALVAACGGSSLAPTPDAGPAPRPPAEDAGEAPRPVERDAGVPRSACLPGSFVDALGRRFACEELTSVAAPVASLPFECHTQGIGWHAPSARFVTTCQDVSGPSARLLSFPRFLADGAPVAAELPPGSAGTHPSSIQIDASGTFAVALAPGSNEGPSEVRFYRVSEDGLEGPLGAFVHDEDHLGAVAYATIGDRTVLLACGWDCASLSVYDAPGASATKGFSRRHHGPTASFVTPGRGDDVGPYNALYLAEACDDRRQLLVATHGAWIDVWAISDLLGPELRLQKLAKRRIDEDVVTHGLRPIFYEGMTLEITDRSVHVWAAPHDFGASGCPSGARCAARVYRCSFD